MKFILNFNLNGILNNEDNQKENLVQPESERAS